MLERVYITSMPIIHEQYVFTVCELLWEKSGKGKLKEKRFLPAPCPDSVQVPLFPHCNFFCSLFLLSTSLVVYYIPGTGGTSRRIGRGCAALFPNSLPWAYLWPKHTIFPTLFITWPNIRYPIYNLAKHFCYPIYNLTKHSLPYL